MQPPIPKYKFNTRVGNAHCWQLARTRAGVQLEQEYEHNIRYTNMNTNTPFTSKPKHEHKSLHDANTRKGAAEGSGCYWASPASEEPA